MDDIKYTSNLLCHFVGRTQPSAEAQYQLLLKIISQNQTLYADVNHPENTEPHAALKMDYRGDRLGELFTFCSCVCFCDIPNESLKIHCSKYSYFGLGFSKSFMVAHGARPVTYIPQNYNMEGFGCIDTPSSPEEYYITFEKQIFNLVSFLSILNENYPFEKQLEEFFQRNPNARETVEKYIFKPIAKKFVSNSEAIKFFTQISGAWTTQCAYVKIFDNTLGNEDPDNYYMEREWRCLHNVPFSLQDIDTIYLPSDLYLERFKNDVHGYNGNFYIFSKD